MGEEEKRDSERKRRAKRGGKGKGEMKGEKEGKGKRRGPSHLNFLATPLVFSAITAHNLTPVKYDYEMHLTSA